MTFVVDLHIHSHHSSDGEWSVPRIFSEARRVGLKAFSIADHDTVDALQEASVLAMEYPGEYLPNVEISVQYQNEEFHLLAPLVDWRNPQLLELLATIQLSRIEQNRKRIGKLQDLGFDIHYSDVQRALGSVPMTGPAIASTLLLKDANRTGALIGHIPERKDESLEIQFYKSFFRHGCPAYVGKQSIDLTRAIETVREAGGVPILAHPGLKRNLTDEKLVQTFKSLGLEGLEVYSSYHKKDTCQYYAKLARHLDLVPTAGSDFHGRLKPSIGFGEAHGGTLEMLDQLKARRTFPAVQPGS